MNGAVSADAIVKRLTAENNAVQQTAVRNLMCIFKPPDKRFTFVGLRFSDVNLHICGRALIAKRLVSGAIGGDFRAGRLMNVGETHLPKEITA